MRLETITGKVKHSVRIVKPVGGLLIVTDQLIKGMTGEAAGMENEEISIQIESGQQQIQIIQPKMKIAQLGLMSTGGEGGMLIKGGKLYLYIPIAEAGSLALDNKAEIVVSFDILKSAKTYDVFGIETPGLTRNMYKYDALRVLAGRKSENIDTTAADMIMISKLAAIKNLEFAKVSAMPDGSIGATNHEFEVEEIDFLLSQTNDLVASDLSGSVYHAFYHEALVLPCDMINQLEIETDGTELDIILRKVVQI